MDENKNDDLQEMGIRSDRLMTHREIQNAAMNYKSVKQAAESDTGIVEWILIGIGIVIILIATIQTLIG